MQNVYVGNRGYAALKKQVDKDTAIVPTVYVPYYNETLSTKITKHRQNTVKGNRNFAQDTNQGLRSHVGNLVVLAEPNTMGYFMDMMLTKGNTSGTDPYTHPFTVGDTENYYTLDLKKGAYVHRFVGVKANSLKPSYGDNSVMMAELSLTALKSFIVATLNGAPSGSGPYTITLSTAYDPTPTAGLVIGDIISVGGVNAIVDAVTATTIEVSEDVSLVADGAQVYLRAATPSFTLLTPFNWARTEYRFGADASTALSAAHTPLDEGTVFEIKHNNESDDGAHTTGAYDPSDLRRLTVDGSITAKRVFDSLTTFEDYNNNNKKACVIRMFAGNTTTHELRITFNNLKLTDNNTVSASDTVTKVDQTFSPQYDSSDAQALDIKVINGVSTI